jgi:hypothetical protein
LSIENIIEVVFDIDEILTNFTESLNFYIRVDFRCKFFVFLQPFYYYNCGLHSLHVSIQNLSLVLQIDDFEVNPIFSGAVSFIFVHLFESLNYLQRVSIVQAFNYFFEVIKQLQLKL